VQAGQAPTASAAMERRTRPRTLEPMQLVVASENLREVLQEAVQHPEEVQEQVAAVVRELLASLRWVSS
jgi:hypothetical protein